MKGTVVRSTGSWYEVRTEAGTLVSCNLKGVFRIQGLKATNPVAVGDHVEFMPGDAGQGAVITAIFPRKNYIIRRSTKLSKTVHILAANIDQLVLVVTLAFPRTSSGFIDRFLVTAEAYKIPAVIFFNKTDLYDDPLRELQEEFRAVYESIPYPCHEVSAVSGENLDVFRDCLSDKVSLVAGHSGVGKSALINAVEPSLRLKTGEVSGFSRKGTHTTTFAEMHPLSSGGYIIDSPGIKEFGLVDFYPDELTHYFPEMFALLKDCRFHNCTHTNEPGCAVMQAVEEGSISAMRYENYLNIFSGRDLEETDYD